MLVMSLHDIMWICRFHHGFRRKRRSESSWKCQNSQGLKSTVPRGLAFHSWNVGTKKLRAVWRQRMWKENRVIWRSTELKLRPVWNQMMWKEIRAIRRSAKFHQLWFVVVPIERQRLERNSSSKMCGCCARLFLTEIVFGMSARSKDNPVEGGFQKIVLIDGKPESKKAR